VEFISEKVARAKIVTYRDQVIMKTVLDIIMFPEGDINKTFEKTRHHFSAYVIHILGALHGTRIHYSLPKLKMYAQKFGVSDVSKEDFSELRKIFKSIEKDYHEIRFNLSRAVDHREPLGERIEDISDKEFDLITENCLTTIEKNVILLYHRDRKGLSYISKKINITEASISQINGRALHKIIRKIGINKMQYLFPDLNKHIDKMVSDVIIKQVGTNKVTPCIHPDYGR